MYKKKPVKSSSGGAKRWAIVATILLSMIGSGWFAFGYFKGDDLSALKELREKMRDDSLTREQRRELGNQMRQEYEKLGPDQRRELWQARELRHNQEMQSHLAKFFALSPDERKKELDKQIDEMEKRRKQREKERAERANRDRGDGGGRGGPGGGGPGGFDRGSQTGADRLARQKDRLNNTTPELRSMRGDYFRMMQDRRAERGLPPVRGRGGWG